ncbi:MAG: TonB-dependent receptor plug domain-containing protein, partial [bacterium]
MIRDQGGVRTMEDLLANAPAVHFLDTTSPTNSEVTIRGSGTSRGTNAEAAVGLYRNGAYVGGGSVGGRTFSRLDLFDVARAEILRGTQGALYGRNAVGGAINVITQQPKFERSGDIF